MKLSNQFVVAFQYAARLHENQSRKGTKTPYLAHLLAVTATVLENGGNEEMAIAALLHDTVEDQGGLETLADIKARFGERVAHHVDNLSDSYLVPKPPWKKRKQEYLTHLPMVDDETMLISLADKLHNARSIVQDFDEIGDKIWSRFNGGQEGVLWYYRSLSNIFSARFDTWLAREFDHVVTRMEKLSENA